MAALVGLLMLGLVLLVFITTQNVVDIVEKSRDVSTGGGSMVGVYSSYLQRGVFS